MEKRLNKIKRKIAAFLSVAMIFTMFAGLSVSAANAGDVVIDDSKTGSIIVHKYVTTSEDVSNDATGTTADAASITENTYQPIKDVKFELYQIKLSDTENGTYTAANIMDYYNGSDEISYIIEKAAAGTQVLETGYYVNAVDKNGDKAAFVQLSKISDETTGADGVCTFSKLALGFYVLVETEAPKYINTPYSAPVIVSVPMVNTDTSDNANEWIYDVNVYPKNYDYAKVVLQKVDDDETTGLNDVQFKLYKKAYDENGDLANDWTEVTKTKNPDGTDNTLYLVTSKINTEGQSGDGVVDAVDGTLVLNGLTSGKFGTLYKLVEVKAPNAYIINKYPIYFTVNSNNTIEYNAVATGATGEKFEDNTDSAKIDYYIPADAASGTSIAYLNRNKDVINYTDTLKYPATLTAVLRNARPMLTKKVESNTTTKSWVQDTQYRLSDVFKYQIISYVPHSNEEIFYKITDTPSVGITDSTYSTANYTVKSADAENAADANWAAVNTDYYTITNVAATTTNGQGFEFVLTADGKTALAGKYIKIEYNANLNKDAVIAGVGNNNEAKLEYSKYIDGTNSEATVYVLKDNVRVYTYQFQITKYIDSIADAKKITVDAEEGADKQNVIFNLLENDRTTLVAVVEESKGVYRIPSADDLANGLTTTNNLYVGTGSTLLVKGLEDETYYLKEIDTIQGYNLLSELFEIKVDVVETTTWTKADTLAGTNSGYTTAGREESAYDSTAYTKGGATITADNTTVLADIVNKKGFTLPKTGSMGFLVFCIIGLVLMLGGAMLIFGGKKKIR